MAFFKLECVCQEIVYLLLHLLLLFIIIIVIVVIIVIIISSSSTVRGKYIMLDSTAQKIKAATVPCAQVQPVVRVCSQQARTYEAPKYSTNVHIQ